MLRLDFDLGGEAGSQQCRGHRLAKAGLRQQQEVVLGAAHDDDGGDDPRLRSQEQRLAGRSRDVVRQHPLEEVLRVGAGHANEVPGPGGHSARKGCHAQ